jgi:Amt family ammonium transporter
VLGTLAGIAWAVLAGAVIYGVLRFTVGIRLTQEEEFEGADLSLHRIGSTPDRESSW